MATKQKRVKLPTYDHAASTFAGIRERLKLVSLVHEHTYAAKANVRSMVQPVGRYMHEVRLMSKHEGWECRFVWTDNSKRVTKQALQRVNVALGIEAARRDWHETLHIISKRAAQEARERKAAA